MVFIRAATPFVLALFGWACLGAQVHPEPKTPRQVRTALGIEIRRQLDSSWAARAKLGSLVKEFREDSIQFEVESSKVVPKVLYFWARYIPPGSAHMSFDALAVTRTGHRSLLLIRNLHDWNELLTSSERLPRSGPESLNLCAEAARFGTAEPTLTHDALVFRSPSDTSGKTLLGRETLRGLLATPQVATTSAGYEVQLWLIERGQTRLLRCTFTKSGVQLEVLRDLPGTGWL